MAARHQGGVASAELGARSNFSFLDGAFLPAETARIGAALGLATPSERRFLPDSRRREPHPQRRVAVPMDTTIATTERAWDARVARLLTKLPDRLRSGVEWLREPSRRPLRLGAAVLLILGGFLSVLPIFGLWMLPLGLALMSDDIPRLKVPLEKVARGVERLWARVRGGRKAG